MLPPEAIKEFKDLYLNVFHEELSDAETSRLAHYVIEFYEAVYLPVESGGLILKQDDERSRR